MDKKFKAYCIDEFVEKVISGLEFDIGDLSKESFDGFSDWIIEWIDDNLGMAYKYGYKDGIKREIFDQDGDYTQLYLHFMIPITTVNYTLTENDFFRLLDIQYQKMQKFTERTAREKEENTISIMHPIPKYIIKEFLDEFKIEKLFPFFDIFAERHDLLLDPPKLLSEPDIEIIFKNSDTSMKNVFLYSFEIECLKIEQHYNIKRAFHRVISEMSKIGIYDEGLDGCRIGEKIKNSDKVQIYFEISYQEIDKKNFKTNIAITTAFGGYNSMIVSIMQGQNPSNKIDAHSAIDWFDQEIRKGGNGEIGKNLSIKLKELCIGLKDIVIRYEEPGKLTQMQGAYIFPLIENEQ